MKNWTKFKDYYYRSTTYRSKTVLVISNGGESRLILFNAKAEDAKKFIAKYL